MFSLLYITCKIEYPDIHTKQYQTLKPILQKMAAAATTVSRSKPDNASIFHIDFETSGLNPYVNEVIEIGIMTADKKHSLSILVKPSKPIVEFTTKLTGITNEMLESEGITIVEAMKTLHSFVETHTRKDQYPWFVAHNGYAFDKLFFDQIYVKHDIEPMHKRPFWLDTYLLSKYAFPKRYSYKLISLCRYENLASEQEHRALADCKLLSLIFPVIIKSIKTKLNLKKGDIHSLFTDIQRRLSLESYQSSTYPSD